MFVGLVAAAYMYPIAKSTAEVAALSSAILAEVRTDVLSLAPLQSCAR